MLLALCPTSVLASSPIRGDCGGDASGDLETLNRELRELVALGDEAAFRCVQHRVSRGLPPAALLALLDAIELDRPEGMVAVAWDLARHRRASVRSRALHTLGAFGELWTRRAVSLALLDADLQVQATGYALALAHPDPRYGAALFEAYRAGDGRAALALAACADQSLLPRLLGLRAEVEHAAWTSLLGALVRRPAFLTPIQRLGVVSSLAAMRTAESQDELRLYLRSGVGATPPQARNVAARALGLAQAPPVKRGPETARVQGEGS